MLKIKNDSEQTVNFKVFHKPECVATFRIQILRKNLQVSNKCKRPTKIFNTTIWFFFKNKILNGMKNLFDGKLQIN